MSWINLSTDDVLTALSGPEYEAYTGTALADGQASPVAEVTDRVIKTVRGYVAGCSKNRLGAGLTIPEELEGAAIALIAWELATRLPLPAMLKERLREKKTDAQDLLEKVSLCRVAVEQPPDDGSSDEDIPGAGTPRVTGKTLGYGRNSQDGI